MDLIRTATASLESISPYSQSRMHNAPRAHDKESHDEYEQRTWREKATVDDHDIVCQPGMAFKQAIDSAARRLSMKVPGKNRATYTKHFAGGVLLPDLIPLGIKKSELQSVTINANANGKRGPGTRVPRTFPLIRKWSATVEFYIMDAEITKEVFERTLAESGFFVGIGRFRPEQGGTNGRFKVVKIAWSEKMLEDLLAA